ncbi:hypothetical protein GWI33_002256, partial [Rhynchophorus ferrugineus]
MSTAD